MKAIRCLVSPAENGYRGVMKALRTVIPASLLAFGCHMAAYADQASKTAKIEEMLALTHADRVVDQMTAQMRPMMAQQLRKLDLPDDARPAIEEMQKKMVDLMSRTLSWQKMKPVYIKIYDETFTEDELAGAVAFYKTPAGQALIDKMPTLMGKTMSVVQDLMGDIIPEITKMTEDIANKYKKP